MAAFGEIVEAVAYLHRHSVVNRDIKASNVKMDAAGQVKLLDFGIAQSRLTPRLTQVGSVIGTLEYLSPEQLRGEDATARADVWSLGILLYEMTTGQLPFPAPNLLALHETIQHAPRVRPTQLNPAIPRVVEEIIARCLDKDPARRYADADELLRAVRNASRKGEEKPQRKPPELHRPDSGTFKASLPIVVGVTALLLCGILTMLLQRPSVQQASQTVSTTVPATVPTNARAENRIVESARESQVGHNQSVNNQATPNEKQMVKIDATGGRAMVIRDGRVVGTTPYMLRENLGEKVALTLQRAGYRARDVAITVNERKRTYSFLLEK